MDVATMAYCWFPTREDTAASLFYLFGFLRPRDISLHIRHVYWATVLSTTVTALVQEPVLLGTNNIYHFKKTNFYFKTIFSFEDKKENKTKMHLGSWYATRLKQENHETVYLAMLKKYAGFSFVLW